MYRITSVTAIRVTLLALSSLPAFFFISYFQSCMLPDTPPHPPKMNLNEHLCVLQNSRNLRPSIPWNLTDKSGSASFEKQNTTGIPRYQEHSLCKSQGSCVWSGYGWAGVFCQAGSNRLCAVFFASCSVSLDGAQWAVELLPSEQKGPGMGSLNLVNSPYSILNRPLRTIETAEAMGCARGTPLKLPLRKGGGKLHFDYTLML